MQTQTFDPSHAREALLYLARRLPSPTVHQLLKLRYFADKLHLSKYGFLASGDRYVAMKFGPVASQTYDLLKAGRGEASSFTRQYMAYVDGSFRVNEENFVALRAESRDELSKAEMACLDEALQQYGKLSFVERTDESHDRAWKKAWQVAQQKATVQEEMPTLDIVDTLKNAGEVREYMGAD